MDDRRFDALVRTMASGSSRRQMVKGLLGLGAVVGAAALTQDAEAARRGFSGPKLPTPPPCVPVCTEGICGGPDGCGGACGCGDGWYCSGGGCCQNIQLEEPGCFWMENHSGLYCWVSVGDDYESCAEADTCASGGSECYKWALSSDTQIAPPWAQ